MLSTRQRNRNEEGSRTPNAHPTQYLPCYACRCVRVVPRVRAAPSALCWELLKPRRSKRMTQIAKKITIPPTPHVEMICGPHITPITGLENAAHNQITQITGWNVSQIIRSLKKTVGKMSQILQITKFTMLCDRSRSRSRCNLICLVCLSEFKRVLLTHCFILHWSFVVHGKIQLCHSL